MHGSSPGAIQQPCIEEARRPIPIRKALASVGLSYGAALLLLLVAFAGAAQQPGQTGQVPQTVSPGEQQNVLPPDVRPKVGEVAGKVLADSIGPYSLFMGLSTAGIHQATGNPPDWRQGIAGFSERFGSSMGINAVGNSVRYGAGWAMNVDFQFQKCTCTGIAARLGHAVTTTALARRRKDGSAVLSVPNLVAPYAATTTAVYAWYPDRYGIKDAFRMGNYNLLGTLTSNLVFEFIPNKALTVLRRWHLSGSH